MLWCLFPTSNTAHRVKQANQYSIGKVFRDARAAFVCPSSISQREHNISKTRMQAIFCEFGAIVRAAAKLDSYGTEEHTMRGRQFTWDEFVSYCGENRLDVELAKLKELRESYGMVENIAVQIVGTDDGKVTEIVFIDCNSGLATTQYRVIPFDALGYHDTVHR